MRSQTLCAVSRIYLLLIQYVLDMVKMLLMMYSVYSMQTWIFTSRAPSYCPGCFNMFGQEKIWPLSVKIYKTVDLKCTGDLSHRLVG